MQAGCAIVLKLDDLRDKPHYLAGFARVLAVLRQHEIVGSVGVIGDSLEGPGKAGYHAFLRELQAGGVELWNHGWLHQRDVERGVSEFKHTGVAEQTATVQRTQAALLEATGVRPRCFGAPYNWNDQATEAALLAAGLDVWFFPEAGTHHAAQIVALTQRVDIEVRTGVVDEAFFTTNLTAAACVDYAVLQGHPAMWDEASFAAFERIVLALKAQGCVFMTATQCSQRGVREE